MSLEKYTTGTGQNIRVHNRSECEGTYCSVHNPSDQHMKDMRTHWRYDRGIMERICEHGVGHPDPDDLAYRVRMYKKAGMPTDHLGVHGCDGCCTGEEVF